jgi:TatD DNase family protein
MIFAMIDAHCHLDLYADPYQIARAIERERVLTIAVTNSPAFEHAYPHVQSFRYIRLALGLHPLTAEAHLRERDRFARCLSRTGYVGEVGLDFSREGFPTREQQLESFRFVLQHMRSSPKFVSVHSRRAETAVLDLLEEAAATPVVFHWFTGSQAQLERLLRQGHYCSVNPAMVQSTRSKALIERIPRDRLLTETDGPFVHIGHRQAQPMDVTQVERFIADLWMCSVEEVRNQVYMNMRAAIPRDRSRQQPHA